MSAEARNDPEGYRQREGEHKPYEQVKAKTTMSTTTNTITNDTPKLPAQRDGRFLSLKNAARELSCTRRFLERRIECGELAVFRPSRKLVRVSRDELDRWVASYSHGGHLNPAKASTEGEHKPYEPVKATKPKATKPKATDGDRELAFVRKWIDMYEIEGVQRTVLKELNEIVASRLAAVEADNLDLYALVDEYRKAALAPKEGNAPLDAHPPATRKTL